MKNLIHPQKNPNFNWKQDEISATFRGIARLCENNNSEGIKPSHKYNSLLQALKIERRVTDINEQFSMNT